MMSKQASWRSTGLDLRMCVVLALDGKRGSVESLLRDGPNSGDSLAQLTFELVGLLLVGRVVEPCRHAFEAHTVKTVESVVLLRGSSVRRP